jgi:AcrR family transcriptional regulator
VSREQAILDAAERLITEHGFHAGGVDMIGEEAGISGSAIYRHFSAKAEILEALSTTATPSSWCEPVATARRRTVVRAGLDALADH